MPIKKKVSRKGGHSTRTGLRKKGGAAKGSKGNKRLTAMQKKLLSSISKALLSCGTTKKKPTGKKKTTKKKKPTVKKKIAPTRPRSTKKKSSPNININIKLGSNPTQTKHAPVKQAQVDDEDEEYELEEPRKKSNKQLQNILSKLSSITDTTPSIDKTLKRLTYPQTPNAPFPSINSNSSSTRSTPEIPSPPFPSLNSSASSSSGQVLSAADLEQLRAMQEYLQNMARQLQDISVALDNSNIQSTDMVQRLHRILGDMANQQGERDALFNEIKRRYNL